MTMTSRRRDLIAAVSQIQNHSAHTHHDIVTFCGWIDVTEADIERHIESNMRLIAEYSDRGGKGNTDMTTKLAVIYAVRNEAGQVLGRYRARSPAAAIDRLMQDQAVYNSQFRSSVRLDPAKLTATTDA